MLDTDSRENQYAPPTTGPDTLIVMTAFGENVTAPEETAAVEWLFDRLGEFGTVGGLVPSGYARCVLLDHRTVDDPEWAEMTAPALTELMSLAAQHTSTPDQAWFAVWTGYGWTGSKSFAVQSGTKITRRQLRHMRRSDEERSTRVSRALSSLPRFELPNREYYLLNGPVGAASGIGHPDDRGLQVPDLWWPEDRAWFVATDTDLSWTYVGCDEAFAAHITSSERLNARAVDRSDWNADAGATAD